MAEKSYFCGGIVNSQIARSMAKKNTEQVISLDAFGSAKNYWICWMQSTLPHLSFANLLQKELKRPCAFVGDIAPEESQPLLKFPMYALSFNLEFDVNLVAVANHVTAPMEMSLDQQNPLLGGLLFEDEYYLFNKQGLTKIPFSVPMADFVVLLSADKEADIEDYIQALQSLPGVRILYQETPQNAAQGQKKRKAVLDFIQYLFYESEAAVKEYRRRKLFRKLHFKMSVAEANYGRLKFPMEDNRMITSDLLRREDL